MPKRLLTLSKANKIVEEHVSPGGKTRYTTKVGATEAAKRQSLGRARYAQGHRAPREDAKRKRETNYQIEEKAVVSPGGQTVYVREMTPRFLKPDNPLGLSRESGALATYERKRRLLWKRQSKRLLDARARNEAAAAELTDDDRLKLGLTLLREAVTGCLVVSSNIQLRGAVVNALVCLKTPDDSEYYCEGPDPDPWNELQFPEAERRFYRQRSENAQLLVKAGCCTLVTKAVRMFLYDTNVALAGFGLAKFLYADTGHGIEEEVALMLYHQGMASLAVHALLRPCGAWSSTDFRSAGNIFWAVSVIDHTPAWEKELEEFVNSKGYNKTTGVAHMPFEGCSKHATSLKVRHALRSHTGDMS